MQISVFVTIWAAVLSPGDVASHVDRSLGFLQDSPSVAAVEFYEAETGELPPLHDVPAPTAIVQIDVDSVDAAKKLVASRKFKKGLLDKKRYAGPVEKIDLDLLEAVHYPIPGHAAPPPRIAPLSFVVRYYGPVRDHKEFVEFYTTNHPPLLAKFPGIRNVLCYLPLNWRETGEITDASVVIGNEVVFDDLDSLNRALASDALGPVMEDSKAFPPVGFSTHYVMQRKLLYRAGAKRTN